MSQYSTVLVIDDDWASRVAIEGFLASDSYRLVFANDGPEGLIKARETKPDLILLDVRMPGIDGFEVCRQLRGDPSLGNVPIIMLTILDDRESRLAGFEAGADEFLHKPFDRLELQTRVRTITRLNRFQQILAERTRFQWVIEGAEDGHVLMGADGAIHYANRQAQLFLDMAPDTPLPGKETFLSLARRRYRCQPEAGWSLWSLEKAEDIPSPLYLIRSESAWSQSLWLQVDALDTPGNVDGARLVRLRNVTAMMASQQAIWAFNTAVAHKLRTPLANLVASLEFLASQAADMSPEQVSNLCRIAQRALNHHYDNICDIVQYLEGTPFTPEDGACTFADIQPMIDEIAVKLGIAPVHTSGEGGIADSQLAISRHMMELVLWEVLENARKFHPQHSPAVTIHGSLAGGQPGPGKIAIRIADDGINLSPDQLLRIWTPYYQAEKVFTGQVAGMGLGLTMVGSTIWGAGGTCKAYNRDDGPGLVVELILPLSHRTPDPGQATGA